MECRDQGLRLWFDAVMRLAHALAIGACDDGFGSCGLILGVVGSTSISSGKGGHASHHQDRRAISLARRMRMTLGRRPSSSEPSAPCLSAAQ